MQWVVAVFLEIELTLIFLVKTTVGAIKTLCSVRFSHKLIYKYFFTNLITPSQASVPRIAATNEYAANGTLKGIES